MPFVLFIVCFILFIFVYYDCLVCVNKQHINEHMYPGRHGEHTYSRSAVRMVIR